MNKDNWEIDDGEKKQHFRCTHRENAYGKVYKCTIGTQDVRCEYDFCLLR